MVQLRQINGEDLGIALMGITIKFAHTVLKIRSVPYILFNNRAACRDQGF